MSAAVDKIYEQIKQLSEAERAEFVERMVQDGVGLRVVEDGEEASAEMSPEIDEAWRAEVRQRSADLHAGRVKTTPWADVRREIFGAE